MDDYYITIDQTGHGEGLAICIGNRQIAYLSFNDEASERQAEEDAKLIVNALNAYKPE